MGPETRLVLPFVILGFGLLFALVMFALSSLGGER